MQSAHRALLASRIRVALHKARCILARRRCYLEFDGRIWRIIED
jgi:hypothetical protein